MTNNQKLSPTIDEYLKLKKINKVELMNRINTGELNLLCWVTDLPYIEAIPNFQFNEASNSTPKRYIYRRHTPIRRVTGLIVPSVESAIQTIYSEQPAPVDKFWLTNKCRSSRLPAKIWAEKSSYNIPTDFSVLEKITDSEGILSLFNNDADLFERQLKITCEHHPDTSEETHRKNLVERQRRAQLPENILAQARANVIENWNGSQRLNAEDRSNLKKIKDLAAEHLKQHQFQPTKFSEIYTHAVRTYSKKGSISSILNELYRAEGWGISAHSGHVINTHSEPLPFERGHNLKASPIVDKGFKNTNRDILLKAPPCYLRPEDLVICEDLESYLTIESPAGEDDLESTSDENDEFSTPSNSYIQLAIEIDTLFWGDCDLNDPQSFPDAEEIIDWLIKERNVTSRNKANTIEKVARGERKKPVGRPKNTF